MESEFYLSRMSGSLTILQPQRYQVTQRSSSVAGSIAVQGVYTGPPGMVEARFNGGVWTPLDHVSADGQFNGTLLDQPTGQGILDVRLRARPAEIAQVEAVGIGDIFIVAGQSNASGRGTTHQAYHHATLKASMFAADYHWHELADPVDRSVGRHDQVVNSGGKGSVWPLVATLYLAAQNMPVAFVPVVQGGSSITFWLPGPDHGDRTTAYGALISRGISTGARTVLWWQGETDAIAGMCQATYNRYLDLIADSIHADLGARLMPCLLQCCSGIAGTRLAEINHAITEAWHDNSHVLAGPDLSDMVTDDGYHFKCDTNLHTAASRWWSALATAL